MLVETAFILSLGYLLWKGGKKPPLPTPPSEKKGPGPTPAKTKWPAVDVPPPPPPLTPDDKQAIAAQEAQHGAETTKFQAQLAEAKAKAGNDKYAQNDIAKKAAARKKALDDWKRDIEAAKRGG